MNKAIKPIFIIVLIISYSLKSGCDETFIPWQENDKYHFSIYGYLDASADTQWVRVMPVREDLFYEPKPIDAIVTLEHVETGEIVVMNDSLFTDAHGRYAWNFWAPMKLKPDHTYRITAERSDEKTSHADVTLPPDFPVPVLQRSFTPWGSINYPDVLVIKGVDQLVDLRSIYFLEFSDLGQENIIFFSHLSDTNRTISGDYRINIDPRDDLRAAEEMFYNSPGFVADTQIYIASGGPDFHFFPGIDEKVIIQPEGISNVENGVGYLAGIVSKTIPFRSCYNEGPIDYVPCELQPPPW